MCKDILATGLQSSTGVRITISINDDASLIGNITHVEFVEH